MTELVWEGKYDKDGRKLAPLRVALPFQTVETVNESVQERQRTLDLFSAGRDATWRNRLIWGDKKYVLPALLREFTSKVDLIYIDPPFATGSDFSFVTQVPNSETSFTKEPSVIEQKAYRDTWGRGIESYLAWFYETAVLLRDLLSESASLYVHLDWHVSHYAKACLDEVFGRENFVNEIIWAYEDVGGRTVPYFKRKHDCLLLYQKGSTRTFNVARKGLSESTLRRYRDYLDEKGQITYRRLQETNPGVFAKLKGVRDLDEVWLDINRGAPMNDWWTDISPIKAGFGEYVNYATQKPEALLERIVSASTNAGDLVLDCFCGSGTTAVVAEKLARRWIACDLGRFAVHTTRKRLLGLSGVSPFVVQNLGKYERQHWQRAEFGGQAEARGVAYRRFILDLYKAKPIDGHIWLHGVKQGRMVHVGTVDAPVTVGDIKQIATEFRKAIGTGENAPSAKAVDVLGWDFAFELNEVARQEASRAGIDIRFLRIPRDVLDKRAIEQGDIRFFELAALAVEVKQVVRAIELRLTDFMIPLDDVPDEIRQAITDWSQWIDYWAVDWDNKGDTFHNEWQTYRSKKGPALEMLANHDYQSGGTYQVVVKVIDILGNDTTKTIKVEVP